MARAEAVGRQADRQERALHRFVDFAARAAELLWPERHVVAARRREELELGHLEDEADAPLQLLVARFALRPAVEHDVALVGREQAAQELEQRRLARAGRAEERDVRSGRDREVDGAQRLDRRGSLIVAEGQTAADDGKGAWTVDAGRA
jgi:hypothetical protein